MPHTRHEMILKLIAENEVPTQEALRDLLLENGVSVTQATISRDIRILGLRKRRSATGVNHYVRGGIPATAPISLLKDVVIKIDHAINTIVLRCHPGSAQAACVVLDRMQVPEIVGTMPDVSKYDVIFFGYPIWWHDLPMVCYTFFDKVKLEGKTVAPFCTHEGSGLSDTDRFIAKTTGATVTEALEMYGTKAQNWKDEAKQETLAWLKKIGYEK